MLNEVSVLQFFILLTIFFLFWSVDVFTTLLLAVVYLSLSSLYALLLGSDIIISFLIIIDLGVFLVTFSFLLHVSKFLQIKNNNELSFLNINKSLIVLPSITFLYYFVFFDSLNYKSVNVENLWFFYISYYNYYDINNLFINNDLQLLKELYFYINNYEFFIVSIAIYIGLIASFSIFKFTNKMVLNLNTNLLWNLKTFNVSNSSYFFRYQDIIKQSQTTPNSKVWNKKKKWF